MTEPKLLTEEEARDLCVCGGDAIIAYLRERGLIAPEPVDPLLIEAMKQPAPAMAGIPDPQAYVAAFEAMVEALDEARTELEGYAAEFMGENYNSPSLNAALQAARIARGDA